MEISFLPAPPGDEEILMAPEVLLPGRASGGAFSALYTRPTTIGLSGSPSRKSHADFPADAGEDHRAAERNLHHPNPRARRFVGGVERSQWK